MIHADPHPYSKVAFIYFLNFWSLIFSSMYASPQHYLLIQIEVRKIVIPLGNNNYITFIKVKQQLYVYTEFYGKNTVPAPIDGALEKEPLLINGRKYQVLKINFQLQASLKHKAHLVVVVKENIGNQKCTCTRKCYVACF